SLLHIPLEVHSVTCSESVPFAASLGGAGSAERVAGRIHVLLRGGSDQRQEPAAACSLRRRASIASALSWASHSSPARINSSAMVFTSLPSRSAFSLRRASTAGVRVIVIRRWQAM